MLHRQAQQGALQPERGEKPFGGMTASCQVPKGSGFPQLPILSSFSFIQTELFMKRKDVQVFIAESVFF
jgi:hypothetical protein